MPTLTDKQDTGRTQSFARQGLQQPLSQRVNSVVAEAMRAAARALANGIQDFHHSAAATWRSCRVMAVCKSVCVKSVGSVGRLLFGSFGMDAVAWRATSDSGRFASSETLKNSRCSLASAIHPVDEDGGPRSVSITSDSLR
jgi:hypothetical protein